MTAPASADLLEVVQDQQRAAVGELGEHGRPVAGPPRGVRGQSPGRTTRRASVRADSSATNQTPPANDVPARVERATSTASLVLPVPPGPTSVVSAGTRARDLLDERGQQGVAPDEGHGRAPRQGGPCAERPGRREQGRPRPTRPGGGARAGGRRPAGADRGP